LFNFLSSFGTQNLVQNKNLHLNQTIDLHQLLTAQFILLLSAFKQVCLRRCALYRPAILGQHFIHNTFIFFMTTSLLRNYRASNEHKLTLSIAVVMQVLLIQVRSTHSCVIEIIIQQYYSG